MSSAMRLELNPIFKPCPRSFEFGKKGAQNETISFKNWKNQAQTHTPRTYPKI
jgi:hypothetical protein